MGLRDLVKRSQTAVGAVRDAEAVGRWSWRRATPAAVRAYIQANTVRKLQLGAGPTTPLGGWLSTDIIPGPHSRNVYMDATKPFPIPDGTFDYAYTEHMIEHIPWAAGAHMLQECFRVLKPGGKVRVATPDVARIIGLYARPGEHPVGEKYVRYITDTYLPHVKEYQPLFVVNNAFRNWGHQFLYDADLLEAALLTAGFTAVGRREFGKSDDPQLNGLEHHGVNIENEDMAAFETMVFEGAKPAGPAGGERASEGRA